VNALGILACSQISAALVRRVGAAALLTVGVFLALAAAAAMLVGVLVSTSVAALLVPLFVLVSCTGLISPNATAVALERHGALAGSASALLGLAQFSVAAVVPPLASLGGASPTALATTALATAAAAAAAHAVVLRMRPTPDAAALVPTGARVPVGTDRTAPAEVAAAWDQRLHSRVPEPARDRSWHRAVDPRAVPGPQPRGRLQWVEVGQPDEVATGRPGPRPAPVDDGRRQEWERIAALARRARLAADATDPGPR
jgi:MFS family permease